MRCEANSKRSGERCKNNAMKGKSVCRNHGGKSLSGSASPLLKTGRYSRFLPESLAERYENAASDPELLSLREDVALLDGRLSQLLEKADAGESTALWARVQKAWFDYQDHKYKDDAPKYELALANSIEAGAKDIEVWTEIGLHLESRRKMTETERKRLVEMQQMVRTDQAMTLVAAVVASVRSHVKDREALNAISRDITGLVHANGRGSVGATLP